MAETMPRCDRCGKPVTATMNGVPFCTRKACLAASGRGETAAGRIAEKIVGGFIDKVRSDRSRQLGELPARDEGGQK